MIREEVNVVNEKAPTEVRADKAELESNRKPFLLKKPNYLVIVWIISVTKCVTI